jgi:hypothetical protein
MLNQPDLRYKANGEQTAAAWQVCFPVRLQIQRVAAEPALAEARELANRLRHAVEDAELSGLRLALLDPDGNEGRGTSELVIEQKSSREVRLQITLAVVLTLEGTDSLWERAAAIAATADFLQSFATRPLEKGIEVDVRQARTVRKGESAPKVNAGESV